MKRLNTWFGLIMVVAMLSACAAPTPAPAAPAAKPAAPAATAAPAPAAPAAAAPAPAAPAAPAATAAPAAPAAKPADQKPVVILQSGDVVNLDPQGTQNLADVIIKQHIFETLMRYNDKIELVPYLAESYKNIDDLTWEFKIRSGHKFTNGQPVNADAVVFSLMRGKKLFDKKEAGVTYAFNLLDLKEAVKVDDLTVRLITNKPNPTLQWHVAEPQTAIFPSNYYKADALEDATLNKPIGSGPYKFVEFVPNDHVTLVLNPDYPGPEKPTIQTLIFRPVPEPATRMAELKSGNADVIVDVPPDLADDLSKTPKVRLATVQGMRRIFVSLRIDKNDALADKRVRQAMNYAFNCDAVMKNILGGRGECTSHIINAPYGSPNVTKYAYDPKKAASLLDDAGWKVGADGIREKDGKKLVFNFDSPNGRYIYDKEISQVIAKDLKAVGIDTKLSVIEWTVLSKKTDNQGAGMVDMTFLGSGPGFSCRSDLALIEGASGSNRTGYKAPAVEELFKQLIPEKDEAKRLALCHKIEELAVDDAPLIFIWLQTDFYGVSERLDWTPRADTRIMMFNAKLK
jgi:peptide/nickel transport system substrate-binding protein